MTPTCRPFFSVMLSVGLFALVPQVASHERLLAADAGIVQPERPTRAEVLNSRSSPDVRPKKQGEDAAAPVEIATPYYTLHASADQRRDAELLAATLDHAIAAMIVDYAAADADKLLRSATVRIHVSSIPNDMCGPGHATNQSSWDGKRSTAEIHILAPSAHADPAAPGSPRTSMDEPMDNAYVQRVLVHEYATVLIESICRSKPRGWSFWDAPPWFVQGSEEYFGAMYSSPHARDVTLPLYKRATLERSLITADWGLDAREPYISGPVLIAFLQEHYGRDAFIGILRSELPTFGAAMREATKASPSEFVEQLKAWLAQGAKPDP